MKRFWIAIAIVIAVVVLVVLPRIDVFPDHHYGRRTQHSFGSFLSSLRDYTREVGGDLPKTDLPELIAEMQEAGMGEEISQHYPFLQEGRDQWGRKLKFTVEKIACDGLHCWEVTLVSAGSNGVFDGLRLDGEGDDLSIEFVVLSDETPETTRPD